MFRFLQSPVFRMPVVTEGPQNHVLQELARVDRTVYAQISRQLEPFVLRHEAVLGVARAGADYVYFVESGVVSLVASSRNGNSVEVAVVGSEGVAGIADALGTIPTPYGLIVQLAGLAYRAPRDLVREHILSCSALHASLMQYSQLLMHQLAQSALCNRFHSAEQRFAS